MGILNYLDAVTKKFKYFYPCLLARDNDTELSDFVGTKIHTFWLFLFLTLYPMYIYLFCVVLPSAFMCALLVYANTTDCPFFLFFFTSNSYRHTETHHTGLSVQRYKLQFSSHLTTHPIYAVSYDPSA